MTSPGLLAIKLFASRVETDAEDIAFLYRKLGFTMVYEGLDLVQSMYGGRPIDAKIQFLWEEIVDSLEGGRTGDPDSRA